MNTMSPRFEVVKTSLTTYTALIFLLGGKKIKKSLSLFRAPPAKLQLLVTMVCCLLLSSTARRLHISTTTVKFLLQNETKRNALIPPSFYYTFTSTMLHEFFLLTHFKFPFPTCFSEYIYIKCSKQLFRQFLWN